MPTYSFIDTDTDEEFDIFMSWSDREEFLKENPSIQPILTSAPALVRGTGVNNKVQMDLKKFFLRLQKHTLKVSWVIVMVRKQSRM
jgi:hypothetical protein